MKIAELPNKIAVSLLTGGSDRPYVYGLVTSLLSQGATVDLIGSDELDFPEFRGMRILTFLNLRGSTRRDVSFSAKVTRILIYYLRLIRYAATTRSKLFHILWNNKWETFDRTLLMLYYRLLGKRVVFTVHNVNAAKRDRKDSFLNRLTLRIQYRLSHHLFVHTESGRQELIEQFGLRRERVSVIPFGINNAVPHSALTTQAAKQRIGVGAGERTLLFFGRITPYKGLDWLIPAFRKIVIRSSNYRLVIAGGPDNCEEYWNRLRESIQEDVASGTILLNVGYIPDDEVEIYFKAADALILPYRDIYQSGVLFLGHSFGLPVLAADVGCLKDEIVAGRNGFVFRPGDPDDLIAAVERYFASTLYRDLDRQRSEICAYATARHSWDTVAQISMTVYADLMGRASDTPIRRNATGTTVDAKINQAQ